MPVNMSVTKEPHLALRCIESGSILVDMSITSFRFICRGGSFVGSPGGSIGECGSLYTQTGRQMRTRLTARVDSSRVTQITFQVTTSKRTSRQLMTRCSQEFALQDFLKQPLRQLDVNFEIELLDLSLATCHLHLMSMTSQSRAF